MYAIPVVQNSILVARDGLKTSSITAKILEGFNEPIAKLKRDQRANKFLPLRPVPCLKDRHFHICVKQAFNKVSL